MGYFSVLLRVSLYFRQPNKHYLGGNKILPSTEGSSQTCQALLELFNRKEHTARQGRPSSVARQLSPWEGYYIKPEPPSLLPRSALLGSGPRRTIPLFPRLPSGYSKIPFKFIPRTPSWLSVTGESYPGFTTWFSSGRTFIVNIASDSGVPVFSSVCLPSFTN